MHRLTMITKENVKPAEKKKLEEICVRLQEEKSKQLATLGYAMSASTKHDDNGTVYFCIAISPINNSPSPPTDDIASRIKCLFADRIYYSKSCVGRDVRIEYQPPVFIPVQQLTKEI